MKKFVRIISVTDPQLWYSNLKGSVHMVDKECANYYLTERGNMILKFDCEDHIDDYQDVKYAKVVVDNIAYYINQQYLEHIGQKLKQFPSSKLTLMMHANFAVDTRTNEIVKCRYLVESIIDKYTGVRS